MVANSRLVELMPRGKDTVSAGDDGRGPARGGDGTDRGQIQQDLAGLVMTFRRVAIETGIVVQGYQVRAVRPLDPGG